jgi:hypothetical protein
MKLFSVGPALDTAWQWIMRICAVGGFAALIVRHGLDAPLVFYVLLIGLFFGPELIAGQVRAVSKTILPKDKPDDE